ncbi:hypothetical protein CAPTEDRAFT_204891 [Capitella teleta]|uniref:Uncharacterized protein n=1 Tax=Capitella teleta TaxID=283909 RepID=R7UB28_CAPTE|nr:hypothetical protein CAPTEDRAFT_204891 [Capitella teleta]|eukprot:ELU00447.1 hypothetical protein CAPTEDRAFT_204891 [Capitella teleta]
MAIIYSWRHEDDSPFVKLKTCLGRENHFMYSDHMVNMAALASQKPAIRDALGETLGEKMKNEMTSLRLETEQTRKEVLTLRKELKQKNKEPDDLRTNVQNLESQIESIELYSRRNSLRISGVEESDKEDIIKETMTIFEEKIKLPTPIAASDIDIIHRVGLKGNKPRPILVKFLTYAARDRVMCNRRSLENSDIYLNEDVTRQWFQLLFQLYQLKAQKKISKAWTHDGTMVVKDRANKFHYARLLHEARALIQELKANN